MPEVPRRRLLVLSGLASASACVDPAPGAPSTDASVGTDLDEPHLALDGGIPYASADVWSPDGPGVDVGAFADFAVGTWRYSPGARAVVARDAQGVFAYTALCSHQGCLVTPPDARGVTVCPCHGSRFDGRGRPVLGPAVTPLQRLAVLVVAGRVRVAPASMVSESARANPIPDGGVEDAGSADAPPPDTGIDPCTTGFDLGPVSQFAPGTWTRVLPRSLIVARDVGGLFAYSARCPHQGCVVDAPAVGGMANCACHGSRFDGNGRVLTGPARADLPHYAVRVCGGRVRVDAEDIVAPTTRTPVP